MADTNVLSVDNNVVVTLDYQLHVEGKEVDAGPIQFLFGHGNIIPGLENQIKGMKIGDEKEVHVEAKDAYGHYDPELEIDVPLTTFPEDFKIELGRPMRMQDGQGHVFTGIAIAITDEVVKLNLNHPLAGKDLVFKTRIDDLRPATETEVQQGAVASSCGGCGSGDCGCDGCS
jgi:FKBP-type peptidyl-prolyl cis-trans isomerase SlyD